MLLANVAAWFATLFARLLITLGFDLHDSMLKRLLAFAVRYVLQQKINIGGRYLWWILKAFTAFNIVNYVQV